jgi:hypothetical protein
MKYSLLRQRVAHTNDLLLVVSVCHLVWAVALVCDISVQFIIPLGAFRGILSPPWIACLLVCSVGTGVTALLREGMSPYGRLLCLLPQQGVLILAAWQVVTCVIERSCDASLVYSRWSTVAEKVMLLSVAVAHTCAVLRVGVVGKTHGTEPQE